MDILYVMRVLLKSVINMDKQYIVIGITGKIAVLNLIELPTRHPKNISSAHFVTFGPRAGIYGE